jgi:hypothetical protein
MTANVVIVAVMTAALVYQSLAAACALCFAVAAFYAGHRLLTRKRLQAAASSREISLRSLMNLIAGVSQHLSGVIRVNCANIAYVPQEIPLLDDSIRNNLLFGLPGRSDGELMKALKTAKLDDFDDRHRPYPT